MCCVPVRRQHLAVITMRNKTQHQLYTHTLSTQYSLYMITTYITHKSSLSARHTHIHTPTSQCMDSTNNTQYNSTVAVDILSPFPQLNWTLLIICNHYTVYFSKTYKHTTTACTSTLFHHDIIKQLPHDLNDTNAAFSVFTLLVWCLEFQRFLYFGRPRLTHGKQGKIGWMSINKI